MNRNTSSSEFLAPPTSSLETVARSIPATGVDFGYCAVSLETKRVFTISNITPRSVTGVSVQYSIT